MEDNKWSPKVFDCPMCNRELTENNYRKEKQRDWVMQDITGSIHYLECCKFIVSGYGFEDVRYLWNNQVIAYRTMIVLERYLAKELNKKYETI